MPAAHFPGLQAANLRVRSELALENCTIGKDIYASRGFTATGGVRLSLAEVSKSASFDGARLGGPGAVSGRCAPAG